MWLKHMVESVSNNSLMVVEQRVKQRQCVQKCSFDLIHTEGTVIRDNDCIMVAPGKTSLATLAVDQLDLVAATYITQN